MIGNESRPQQKKIPCKETQSQPCKLGFLRVLGPLQGYNLSIGPERGIGVQLDYMTFSSESRHHHIPLDNLRHCILH